MWLFTMFDLPVDSREARRHYAEFRKTLVKHGFSMLQFSVYARYHASEEAAELHRGVIKASLPPDGHVRILAVTDRQFGKMENYIGKKRATTEKPPTQLELF